MEENSPVKLGDLIEILLMSHARLLALVFEKMDPPEAIRRIRSLPDTDWSGGVLLEHLEALPPAVLDAPDFDYLDSLHDRLSDFSFLLNDQNHQVEDALWDHPVYRSFSENRWDPATPLLLRSPSLAIREFEARWLEALELADDLHDDIHQAFRQTWPSVDALVLRAQGQSLVRSV